MELLQCQNNTWKFNIIKNKYVITLKSILTKEIIACSCSSFKSYISLGKQGKVLTAEDKQWNNLHMKVIKAHSLDVFQKD